MSDADVFAAALAVRARAYAPYSGFAVGAAVLAADGSLHLGANVENASFGLTVCAERVALYAAIAAGAGPITLVAVAGPPATATPPCGACRQVLVELAPLARILFDGGTGIESTTASALLPVAFELP